MKFNDIPHFMLKAFIERAHELTGSGDFTGDDTEFINPNFIFNNTKDFEWSDSDGFTWSGIEHDTYMTNSYLRGPLTTITTREEGILFRLYRITEDSLYEPIEMRVILNHLEKDRIGFRFVRNYNFEGILEKIIGGVPQNAYEFEIYDSRGAPINLENYTKLYIKKDSVFHNWIKNYYYNLLSDKYESEFVLRNYINTEKDYLYFGTVYQDKNYGNDYFYVAYYNMKHYVQDLVPPHQQSDLLENFLYLAFDVLYNNNYHAQKNIWSLIDPLECDERMLNYLGQYYGMDLSVLDYDPYAKRHFIKQLPYILRSKGTYNAFLTIWKIMSPHNNRFNIYERWHKVPLIFDPTYQLEEDDYIDWLYTSFYNKTDYYSGAGEYYYKEYYNDESYPKKGDMVHYDLQSNKVIHSLGRKNWIVESYDSKSLSLSGYTNTPELSAIDSETMTLSAIDAETLPLSGDLRYIPDSIESKENYYISYPFDGVTAFTEGERIDEYQISNDLIINYFKNGFKIYPDRLNTHDANYIVAKTPDISIEINTAAHIWNINHGLNEKYVVTSVIDDNNYIIKPKRVQLIDENNIMVEFNHPVSGKILIAKSDHVFDMDYEVMISNQYVIEPDLSNEPAQYDKVFSYDMAEALYYLWEVFRPINRTAKYKTLIAPECDLSSRYHDLYTDKHSAFFKTKSTDPIIVQPGSYIGVLNNLTNVINHELNSRNIIIELFDQRFKQIGYQYIDKISIDNRNQVTVVLNQSIFGYALIKRSNTIYHTTLEEEIPEFKHSFPTDDVITQYWDDIYDTKGYVYQYWKDNEVVFPNEEGKIEQYDNVIIENATFNWVQENPIDVWDVQHDFSAGIVYQAFDENNDKIFPKKAEIINNDLLRLSFGTPVSGYVNASPVSNVTPIITASKIAYNHGMNTTDLIIHIYDNNNEMIIPENLKIIDNNKIEITFKTETSFYMFIKHSQKDEKQKYSNWTVMRTGFKYYNTESTVWNIFHNMKRDSILIDAFDNNGELLQPDSIKILNEDEVRIEFSEPQAGYALIIPIGNNTKKRVNTDVYFERVSGEENIIEHNLGSDNLLVYCYDINFTTLIPNDIEIIDNEKIKITINDDIRFYVCIRRSNTVFITDMSNHIYQYWKDNEVVFPNSVIEGQYDKLVIENPLTIQYQDDPADTWYINHGLASSGIIYNTFDDMGRLIFPKTAKIIGTNSIELFFDTPVSGSVSLNYNSDISSIMTAENITYNHGLESQDLIIQIYDNNNEMVIPEKIEILDDNNIEINFDTEKTFYIITRKSEYEGDLTIDIPAGIKQYHYDSNKILPLNQSVISYDKIVYADYDYKHTQSTSADIWEITHNMNCKGVVVDVYDDEDNKISPQYIELIDDNVTRLYFDEYTTGIAYFTKIFTEIEELESNSYIYEGSTINSNITHNLDTDKLIVHAYNDQNERIYPEYINRMNLNTLEIAGYEYIKISILGLPQGSINYARNYPWLIQPADNVNDLIINAYRKQNTNNLKSVMVKEMKPSIWKFASNILIIDDPSIDTVVLHKNDGEEQMENTSIDYIYKHNMNTYGIIMDFYDESGWKVFPETYKLINKNEADIIFEENIKASISHIYVDAFELLQFREKINTTRLWINEKINNFETYDYEFDVHTIREVDEYFLIECKIPKEIDININELALVDDNDDIIIYSQCSDLYKYNKFELNLFYKIKKPYYI